MTIMNIIIIAVICFQRHVHHVAALATRCMRVCALARRPSRAHMGSVCGPPVATACSGRIAKGGFSHLCPAPRPPLHHTHP